MINATDIRKGMVLTIEGELFTVLETKHLTPGNKRGKIQTIMRSLKKGTSVNKRLRSTDRFEEAYLEKKEMEYLYQDGANHVFMDAKNYEQVTISGDLVSDALPYIPLNSRVNLTFHEGNPISVELPASVVLEVTETDPGLKGNSVTNVYKPAKLETGLEIKVPMFIHPGEKVKVDTRSGKFLERG